MNKMFDLHIEVGQADSGDYYALIKLKKTGTLPIILNPGTGPIKKFRAEGPYLDDTVCDLISGLSHNSALLMVEKGLLVSITDENEKLPPVLAAMQKKTQAIARELPSQLAGVNPPDCYAKCTAHEHFSTKKCASYCPNKKLV